MAGAGTLETRAKVIKEVLRTYTYVLTWMSISMAVILFNKWLLAYSGFPYPIALTMWHMIFCSAVGFIAVRVLGVVKSHNMTAREYMTRVMPIGLLYAGSLWLSNTAYLYLSVSFIQMTKSLMPGLVYASGCIVGTEKFSAAITLNMLLIAVGVVVCSIGEVNLVIMGLLQQLVALGFEAMRLTLVQVLINSKGYNMNPMQSLYYVSPACLVCLLVPFGVVEAPRIAAATDLKPNYTVLLANALTAFALNLAVFLLIGKTSALTMNIAGVIKDWMLIFFSFYLFRAPVTTVNLLGYVFCCSGVVWYNQMKLQAIKKRVAAEAGGGGSRKDEETPLLNPRSKEELMAEMRRLQSQMAALESRVAETDTLKGLMSAGGGGGTNSAGANGALGATGGGATPNLAGESEAKVA